MLRARQSLEREQVPQRAVGAQLRDVPPHRSCVLPFACEPALENHRRRGAVDLLAADARRVARARAVTFSCALASTEE